MSAARLREAAALMRSRAEAATTGPWLQEGSPHAPSRNVRAQHQDGWPLQGVAYGVGRTCDATHIASWHPAVALAVAALLETVAEHIANHDCEAHCEPGGCDQATAALAVANAYLGGDA